MVTRVCSSCREEKDLEEFGSGSKGPSRYYCKPCNNEKASSAYRNHPYAEWTDEEKRIRQDYRLFQKYGIRLEDYNLMFEEQKGRCAICRVKPGKRLFHVDHDHETGEVRGLLCYKCNAGLGFFRDNCKFLIRAAKYLQRFERKQ